MLWKINLANTKSVKINKNVINEDIVSYTLLVILPFYWISIFCIAPF